MFLYNLYFDNSDCLYNIHQKYGFTTLVIVDWVLITRKSCHSHKSNQVVLKQIKLSKFICRKIYHNLQILSVIHAHFFFLQIKSINVLCQKSLIFLTFFFLLYVWRSETVLSLVTTFQQLYLWTAWCTSIRGIINFLICFTLSLCGKVITNDFHI